jgi:hypothetical protein
VVDSSLSGLHVARELDVLVLTHGRPLMILTDDLHRADFAGDPEWQKAMPSHGTKLASRCRMASSKA